MLRTPFARGLLLFFVGMFLGGGLLKAEEPLTVQDLLSSEKVVLKPADFDAALETLATVISVYSNSGAEQGGLLVGDRIVALDGVCVYGYGEYDLVRGKNPTKKDLSLIVWRNHQLMPLTLSDLKSGRMAGFSMPRNYSLALGFFKKLGMKGDFRQRQALRIYPERAMAQLNAWIRSQPKPVTLENTPWLKEHLALFETVCWREFSKATAPTEAPVPFINRLNKFYLNIARDNQPKEKTPDWHTGGEGLDFYVLYYPYPCLPLPEPGVFNFSDAKFSEVFSNLARLEECNLLAHVREARLYHDQAWDGSFDDFMGKVQSELLCHDNHRTCPLNDGELGKKKELRAELIQTLQSKVLDSKNDDALLYTYALGILYIIGKEGDKLQETLETLQKKSPYFAMRLSLECDGFVSDETWKKIMLKILPEFRPSLYPFYYWAWENRLNQKLTDLELVTLDACSDGVISHCGEQMAATPTFFREILKRKCPQSVEEVSKDHKVLFQVVDSGNAKWTWIGMENGMVMLRDQEKNTTTFFPVKPQTEGDGSAVKLTGIVPTAGKIFIGSNVGLRSILRDKLILESEPVAGKYLECDIQKIAPTEAGFFVEIKFGFFEWNATTGKWSPIARPPAAKSDVKSEVKSE